MIRYKGITWIAYHGALVPDAAPHVACDLSDKDQEFLLKKSKAFLLRWHCDFDTHRETGYWHVIKDDGCDLQKLSKNTRNQVRKGLKNCTVRRIRALQLAQDGYQVYRKAMKSYRTDDRIMGQDEFRERLEGMAPRDAFEFWEARDHDNNLVAYAQTRIQDRTCNYQIIKLDPDHLKLYAGYALIYTLNRHYLNERKFRYVNDGARSLRHDTGIQDFLIRKFGFRKAYSSLRVSYAPLVGTAIRLLYPFRSIIGRIPASPTRKLSFLLRQEEIRRSGHRNETDITRKDPPVPGS